MKQKKQINNSMVSNSFPLGITKVFTHLDIHSSLFQLTKFLELVASLRRDNMDFRTKLDEAEEKLEVCIVTNLQLSNWGITYLTKACYFYHFYSSGKKTPCQSSSLFFPFHRGHTDKFYLNVTQGVCQKLKTAIKENEDKVLPLEEMLSKEMQV